MKKDMLMLKKSGSESVEYLPRTAVGFNLKAHQDVPPQLRSSATSNSGEQRVRVLVDDDCFYYHSWRNNVVIAFGTLSSFIT